MLTAADFTPLLVNLESMTSKPNAGGGSKDCVAWKVGKAMHNFVHTDKVTMDSSTDLGKEPQPLEGCLTWDLAQPLYNFHRKFLDPFSRLAISRENREDAGIAYSRCGRISDLYKGWKILGVRVAKHRFR